MRIGSVLGGGGAGLRALKGLVLPDFMLRLRSACMTLSFLEMRSFIDWLCSVLIFLESEVYWFSCDLFFMALKKLLT
jgi:hypothetical protein